MKQMLLRTGPLTNSLMVGQTYAQSAVTPLTTTRTLDGNGRLQVLTDARGNSTFFSYDTLDRMLVMTFPDGSKRTNLYDLANDVTTFTDENGSVFTNTFDPLGRKYAVAITPAAGIGGTTAQAFQYDGLSRMTFAQDTVSSTNANVTLVLKQVNAAVLTAMIF